MSRTDRHTALAWADQVDAQRRAAAHPRIPGATRLQLAIVQHLTHPAAALADCGTESLCDQVLTAPGLLFDNVGTEAVLEQVLSAPTRHHRGHPPPEPTTMPNAHHLPGALQQPHAAPPPIPFPADSTRQRYAQMPRIERAIDAARDAGHADGVRQGYRQGWRWGLCCGAAAGVVLASIGWAAYLTQAAPQVAPPSARPDITAPLTSRG
jgi:hypothetical protein